MPADLIKGKFLDQLSFERLYNVLQDAAPGPKEFEEVIKQYQECLGEGDLYAQQFLANSIHLGLSYGIWPWDKVYKNRLGAFDELMNRKEIHHANT